MVNKTTRDGEILVYTVDRTSGAPRSGAQVEIVKNKRVLASGTTDASGILKAKLAKSPAMIPETVPAMTDKEDNRHIRRSRRGGS